MKPRTKTTKPATGRKQTRPARARRRVAGVRPPAARAARPAGPAPAPAARSRPAPRRKAPPETTQGVSKPRRRGAATTDPQVTAAPAKPGIAAKPTRKVATRPTPSPTTTTRRGDHQERERPAVRRTQPAKKSRPSAPPPKLAGVTPSVTSFSSGELAPAPATSLAVPEQRIPAILFEGDSDPLPPVSGPGRRFAGMPFGPGPLRVEPSGTAWPSELEAATGLEEDYGAGRVWLAARDPHTLHVTWDLTPLQRQTAGARLAVRLRPVAATAGIQHVEVGDRTRSAFIHVEFPGTAYGAEIGFQDPAGVWKSLATAAPVSTPPQRGIEAPEPRFVTVLLEPVKPPATAAAPPTPEAGTPAATAHGVPPVPAHVASPAGPPAATEAMPVAPSVPPRAEPAPAVQSIAIEVPPPPQPTSPVGRAASESKLPAGPVAPQSTPPAAGGPVEVRGTGETPYAPGLLGGHEFPVHRTGDWVPPMAFPYPAWQVRLIEAPGPALTPAQVEELRVALQPAAMAGLPSSAGLAPGAVPGAFWPARLEAVPPPAAGEGPALPSSEALAPPATVGFPRGFWFNINAELIVYGATEPDAQVTIDGEPIALRPDGSFTLRFALPDGDYGLAAEAVSADGADSRLARLSFVRRTAYRGGVGRHPTDPALVPPPASKGAQPD